MIYATPLPRATFALWFAVAILVCSCAAAPTVGTGSAASISVGSSPTGTPTPSEPAVLAGSHPVAIPTGDGATLEGREFGDGLVGVVLLHFKDEQRGQSMWFSFAQMLRAHGYRVLTFNFRGFCPGGLGGCSSGAFDRVESWHDVILATDRLKADGATKVFVMGAGLGGHTALWAASRDGVDFAGVIAVSATQLATGGPASYDLTTDVIQRIAEPKLFIAGADVNAEARDDASSMYAAATEPKKLALLESSAAGPELFIGSDVYVRAADQVVLDFLNANS